MPGAVKIRDVAVIGAGLPGQRLAARFAAAGFQTVLEDVLPSNLRRAAESLSSFEQSPHGGVRFASSIEDAVRAADLIVDNVPDELESKLEIFSLLDRMAPPKSIFVTPTSRVSIADLASCTYRPDRCLAVEFLSADVAASLRLSLISTSLTSPEVLDAVSGFWRTAGFAVDFKTDAAEASVAEGTLF